ncbi:uncharacterized protein PFL1_02703 [Pseudozyma flocculosa PF-1]|uniref:SAC domain-containing protein n=1 Tax=Pseudozyma flocculosa PF-1 TaxID=1277687 RepID=A0A061HDE0_9BASI|nr:uncharacterized protein PFL1_02703 [Pseudozyma flocculosa PF-1]EPQ30030.1 hypothetical protein PFL1_02703 [Pseudozyma flocculosa PF-1]
MLPPPKLSRAASFAINSTPTLTPGSTWGPAAASAAAARAHAAEPGRIGDLKRFTLWETKTRFYLVAYNTSQTRFRILKVDRTPPIAAAAQPQHHHHPPSSHHHHHPPSTAPPSSSGDTQHIAANAGADHRAPSTERAGTLAEASRRSGTAEKGAQPTAAVAAAPSTDKHPSNLSASGQRYIAEDDPSIPLLNKAALDTRQPEAIASTAARDSQQAAAAAQATQSVLGLGSSSSTAAAASSAGSSRIQGSAASGPPAAGAPAHLGDAIPPSSASTHPAHSSASRRHASRQYPPASADADWELNVTSDTVVYTRTQVTELLDMIREGNRASGGLKEVGRFFGIVGFVRFTSTYHMVLISRRSVVALIGGHYIYHCDETVTLPVCHPTVMAALPGRTKAHDQEEARLLHLFKQVDLGKNFYFSYTYDLTKTLQDNLTAGPQEPAGQQRAQTAATTATTTAWGYNEKFIWNHHLLLPAFGESERSGSGSGSQSDADARNGWVLPLVYGFVDQAKLGVLSRTVYVTLIARRSRHFAGARFLKRGVNERGQVANDVETEQIVSEALTTPFFAPAKRPGPTRRQQRRNDAEIGDAESRYDASPRYTSYVMMRGSIPVFWTQDSTNMSPRPPIEISLVDPFYSAAALHFDDLFHRYGTPVIVLNLIKSKEKQEREVKLLRAFGECIEYLNQFLPAAQRIRHIAWDMSRASKSHDQDVIGILEDIAEESVETTRFFHSGPQPGGSGGGGAPVFAAGHDSDAEGASTEHDHAAAAHGHARRRDTILLQDGVVRVNCVDCLDRTNAAQFVIGKAAFGHQLHALGLLDDPSLPFDSDAVNMLTEMYHDLGDTIAMQYGGSALAHTTDTYRKINQWTSHSRDVLESMKRFYANSFADADKQAAINLFLGVDAPDFAPYVFAEKVVGAVDAADEGQATSASSTTMAVPFRPHYRQWFTPAHLAPNRTVATRARRLREVANTDAGFWAEYYRPSLFTDLQRHHAYKMTAVHQSISYGPGSTAAVAAAAAGAGYGHGHGPGQGHPSAAYGAIGRHMRSASTSSGATATAAATAASPVTEKASASAHYPSPFKPHGASSQHRSTATAAAAVASSSSSATAVDAASTRQRHFKRPSIDSNSGGGGGGASLPPSPSASSVTTMATTTAVAAPSKALIGGVKRWMSINRPGHHHHLGGRDASGGSMKRGGRRSASMSMSMSGGDDVQGGASRWQQSGGDTEDVGRLGLGLGQRQAGVDASSQAFNFAGPWQAMGIGLAPPAAALPYQAIPAAHYALEAVLAKVCKPSVSHDEEAEYSFYTSQFRNESLTGAGAGPALDEWSIRRHQGETYAPINGGGGGESNRFIDEKDVRIYEESVALQRGEGVAVDELLRSGSAPGAGAGAGSGSRFVGSSSGGGGGGGGGGSGGVDPVLVAYVSSYEALLGSTSLPTTNLDAKVRAYSSWLQMGY